jgi:hypothetical protein
MRISLDDIAGERAALALDVLASGKEVVKYEQISLTNFGKSGFEVWVWSQWQLENISRSVAQAEVVAGAAAFETLLASWPKLAATLGSQWPPCYLHSDYGMGSTRICELLPDGQVHWEVESLAHAT